MKIGPVRIELANKKAPDQEELGATGTTFFGGSLSENEYNTDLRGSKGILIYDKMRRSDARVKISLLVCELPLRAVTWTVQPPSDDNRDKEIAQALQDNLFNMSITWDSFLHHALLMLPFGFSMFEKVWEIVDGQVRYRKLAPRLPQTLYKWDLDETGGLKGIVQYVQKGTTFAPITIPAEKLLVFTNDKEGSNFEGISILRTAYKHWYYKDNLYRIDGIAAERHALGIPYFKHPSDADKASKDNIDAIGQRLYAHEQAYVRLAEGYDFKVEGLSGTIKDIMPSIEHHDKKIAESVLADFIDLGGGDKGSWALSNDKSKFFLMALGAVGTNICDTMNAYVIPQWVDYNYADVKVYPKLTAGNLETREMLQYAQAVTSLLQSGGLTAGPEVESTLRDLLKLPPKPEANQQSEKKVFSIADPKKKRDLTMAEKSVAFDEINKRLNTGEEDLVKAASAVQKRQIAKLTDVATKIVEKKQLSKLDDIDVPFRAEMAQSIAAVLLDLYRYGREQVNKELAIQKKLGLAEPQVLDPTALSIIEEFLKTRAKANANLLATKLKSAITFAALNQIRQGVMDRDLLYKVLEELSDKELLAMAQYSVSEAFLFGRSSQAAELGDEFNRVQYSAILDNGTCQNCEPMDGEEWDFEDPRTEKYARGNPDCLGSNRCRCLLVYISKYERRNPQ